VPPPWSMRSADVAPSRRSRRWSILVCLRKSFSLTAEKQDIGIQVSPISHGIMQPAFSASTKCSQRQHLHARPLPFSLRQSAAAAQKCFSTPSAPLPFSFLSGKEQHCGGSHLARDTSSSRLRSHSTPACLRASLPPHSTPQPAVSVLPPLLRTAPPTASDARDGDGTGGGR
jgi:hypothetical protein